MGSQPVTSLGNPCLSLSLLGQCPAVQNSGIRQPGRKPPLGGESNSGLGPLLDYRFLPAELMERGRAGEGNSHAEGMRLFLGESQRLMAPLERLVRIPKVP